MQMPLAGSAVLRLLFGAGLIELLNFGETSSDEWL